MKIEDVNGGPGWLRWSDECLVVALESARANLIALRKRHPEKSGAIPASPPSAELMLAKARQLHSERKSDSMKTISIESYVDELCLDAETRVLLENMT